MKIPLCRPSIDDSELSTINKSLRTPWLTHGPYNLEFEKNLKIKLNLIMPYQ